MAYDLIVYTRSERLPSPTAFATALACARPPITLEVEVDLPRHAGYLPVRTAGRATGFEVRVDEISGDVDDLLEDMRTSGKPPSEGDLQYLHILQTCDVMVTFSGQTRDEISAALGVARVLARLSGGWLTDPQEDWTVEGSTLREDG